MSVIDALGEGLDMVRVLPGKNLQVRGLLEDEICSRLPSDVDLIGISCMYSNEWVFVRRLIARLGQLKAGIPIVVGGEHITADVDYVFSSCPEVTFAVLGEGEETLLELLQGIEKNGTDFGGIPGIAYKDHSGELQKTEKRARITDLDGLPWPSWEEIPLENYFTQGSGITSFKGRVMPLIATRGCPYQCTFCSNPQMWGLRWRPRQVDDVIAEMKYYIKRYKVTHFEFHDLTAIVNKRWTLAFTERLIQENLGTTWSLPSGTRSEALTEQVLENLYKSGCRKISYAPESGSKSTLERIKKKVDLDKMLSSMSTAIDVGIIVRAHMIFGFPGQTKKEIWESFVFILKMAWVGIHDVSVYLFSPYPGSELFSELQKDGAIPRNDEDYERFLTENITNNVGRSRSWSAHLSDRELYIYSLLAMALFYSCQFLFRPARVASVAWRLVKKKPETILDGYLQRVVGH